MLKTNAVDEFTVKYNKVKRYVQQAKESINISPHVDWCQFEHSYSR